MKRLFADTSYYLALLNPRDALHEAAQRIAGISTNPTLTTVWVLTEVADAFSRSDRREEVAEFIIHLMNDVDIRIAPLSQTLFDAGLELYSRRPDKAWSLTDCISFVVMDEYEVKEALTADRHFEQAGFKALLADSEQ